FRVYQDDQLITSWSGLKGQSILKYLIAHHARPISKDMLMEVFWPDADPKSARRNLHQAIYSLRQILRGEQPDFQHVRFEDGFYYLNPMMDIWLDFVEFESQVQTGLQFEAAGQSAAAIKAYGAAEGLYLGDFMDEDIYERWPEVQRENLRNKYLEITDRLAQYYMEQGEFIAGAALSRKLLSKDNCHEGAHRRLMQCYMAQGQRHLAVRQYQTCIQTLQEELDIGPSEETTALYRRI
ncbi:MAG: winged helix-turn-helix domain-containing protein, partial [Anaerolineaceae bacterium]